MRMSLLFGLSLIALASVARAEDTTVYKKKSTLDFSEMTLEGELSKPMEGAFQGRTKTKFKAAIKFRPHFDPELHRANERL